MVSKKQVWKSDKNTTSKKKNPTLTVEDRLQAFANIIVERILEDNLQGSLQYKRGKNL